MHTVYTDGGHSSKGVAAAAWGDGAHWDVLAWREPAPTNSILAELTAAVRGLAAQVGPCIWVTDCNQLADPDMENLLANLRQEKRWPSAREAGLAGQLADLATCVVAVELVPGHADSTPAGLQQVDRLERWARHQLLADPALDKFHATAQDHPALDLSRWDRKPNRLRRPRAQV